MMKKGSPRGAHALAMSMDRLRRTMEEMVTDYENLYHPGKHLFLAFLKGVVYGLGLIGAVAIVIPIVLAALRGIEWVPLIGDFVSEVADRVEERAK